MGVPSCSAPMNQRMLSLNSPFTSQFPATASKRRVRIRSNNNYNKNAPLLSYLPSSTKRRFTVFSHFSRTTPRRNSLRKKLSVDLGNRVGHVPPDIRRPSPSLADKDAKLEENLAVDSPEEVGPSSKLSDSRTSGDAAMFDRLKNWVEQHERDSEFEGLGSEPTFTNPERVPEEGRDSVGLNQMRRSSLREGIQGSGLRPKFAKDFPRTAGIMLFYGFVAVWALRKLFHFGDKEVELLGPEKEMMRRKVKSRKEREALEAKVYVEEIVREPSVPVFLGEKPKIDKQELVKEISRVTTGAALPESSIGKAAGSTELDVKIREIRQMAREARQIEIAKNESVETQSSGVEGEDGKEEATRLDGDDGAGFILDEAFKGNGNVTSKDESTDVIGNHGVMHLAEDELLVSREGSVRVKPRIIRSVKEARAYLFEKNHAAEGKEVSQVEAVSESNSNPSRDERYNEDDVDKQLDLASVVSYEKPKANRGIASYRETGEENIKRELTVETETWNESNVDEQIAKKIGIGFRDNYMAARNNKNSPGSRISSLEELRSIVVGNELDWMEEDNHLAEIVFRVRDNELAGKDPFHEMDPEDKEAFFKGLEKRVEKENQRLLVLHEWLHSNIENLDYGVDGISVYDPLEKIIPRWKGPILEKSPEFMNSFNEQRKALFAEYTSISNNLGNEKTNQLQKSGETKLDEDIASSSSVNDPNKKLRNSKQSSKTIIESSDGTVKQGKKSGKEFWQHTKKWSRGFLEVYNAETDPDVKSSMKDMGKGLDRWITEEEIQEAAKLKDKLPEQIKEFMDKKLGKIKREMELFGPQAVMSKYREYGDDDEEDYLWWLDLPHILCIELYTVEEGEQSIGFYSLEMASDLELEPKPYHVIAFEDAGDCKNLSYIIKAKMETLVNGHAFVVALPPKDCFQEAKLNGFSVTVIRKGELQLDLDQTLEEVEEQICEIGSKIYHDKIMRERSVDMSSLMKGVYCLKTRPSETRSTKSSTQMQKKRGSK